MGNVRKRAQRTSSQQPRQLGDIAGDPSRLLAAREKWQGQNRLRGSILYDHY
jgi:hypothetical protein